MKNLIKIIILKLKKNKKKEEKNNLDSETNNKENKKDEINQIGDNKNNINNFNIEFMTNKKINNKNVYDDNNYINPNIMKRQRKYPVNFYTTQQIRKKEHFTVDSKITFEERLKTLQKKEQKEKEEKNLYLLKNGLHFENFKD